LNKKDSIEEADEDTFRKIKRDLLANLNNERAEKGVGPLHHELMTN